VNYVILDIEFNGRKFASDLPMEVIEIGAVRLDSQLRQVDEFSALIKPVYFSKLNSFIKKKTGIPQEDIDQAAGFVKVISEFISWLNRSETFLLLTWGGEDLKRIIYDTRMHKLDDAFWMAADYFDLLKGFTRYKNMTNDVSVEGALLDLNIEPSGSAHRALDDARMTSEVFCAIFDKIDFGHTQQFKDVYSNAKERRMVKSAIRSMTLQKIPLTWENLFERYLREKVSLEDPRKLKELQQCFTSELTKEKKPVAVAAE
jgi:inhibitor of KinA sporulation pathway (predicted exonuclease)